MAERIKKKRGGIHISKSLYLMLIPGVLLTLIYAYGPMFGLVIAFKKFSMANGILGSEWVGLDNFVYLFKYYPNFTQIIANTVIIAVLKMIFNFFVPVIVALMLNELSSNKFRRGIQTIVYLPHFISWVVIAGILIVALHPTDGIINNILKSFGVDPIYFLGNNKTFRPVLVISDVWKNFGYGTIIYMAALTGIDPTLYEEATIDRANRLQKMWHITLPGILPIIVLVTTLNMGGILNAGFDQIFAISNYLVVSVADIIDTYVYRIGMEDRKFSEATAAGLFQSAIGMALVIITNCVAKKIDPESGIM
ncbi:MAG: ABC transporter permease subunit [Clostridiales bacterium]